MGQLASRASAVSSWELRPPVLLLRTEKQEPAADLPVGTAKQATLLLRQATEAPPGV